MKDATLFDTEDYLVVDPNPCVMAFGRGPAGKRCRTCVLLLKHGNGRRHWYKCSLRRSLHDPTQLGGPETDHRMKWRACAKYTEEEQWKATA